MILSLKLMLTSSYLLYLYLLLERKKEEDKEKERAQNHLFFLNTLFVKAKKVEVFEKLKIKFLMLTPL